jgi:hypothetical protein
MDARVERAVRKLAEQKKLDPALLLAVVEIECPRPPFEADGVTPRFLFERHVFYRQLAKIAPEVLAEAEAQGLAHKDWRRQTQYKDQGSSKGRMLLLQKACGINMEAAYASCSWGMGQIMGFNARKIGYTSATHMFSELRAGGIHAQLECMWRYMDAVPGLIEALKARNWEAFAKGYNGPAFAQNDYDTRLAAAYKGQKDKDVGEVPEEDEELPLGRTPVQNAEGPSPWKTPEGVATTVAAGTGVIAATKGASSKEGHAPLDYAIAFVIVGAFIVGAWFFIKRLRRNPE